MEETDSNENEKMQHKYFQVKKHNKHYHIQKQTENTKMKTVSAENQ